MFNGKLIYEVFSGKKEFGFGRQPNLVEGTNTVREGADLELLSKGTSEWKISVNNERIVFDFSTCG